MVTIAATRISGNVFSLQYTETNPDKPGYSCKVEYTLGQKTCPVGLLDGANVWDAKAALKAAWAAINTEAANKGKLVGARLGVRADWKHGVLNCTATTVHVIGTASAAQRATWLQKYEATSGKRMAKAIAMARGE